jgi:hypothetical protein
MRLVTFVASLLGLGLGAVILSTTVFRPAAAADRLPGVRIAVTRNATEDLGDRRHLLTLTIQLDSATDIDQCLGFTLDEPSAGRRMQAADGSCLRPTTGRHTVRLVFDQLTDDDLLFPDHTLVWGIPGGRFGPIFEAFGACVVEQAGTADFSLPTKNLFPSFASFGPLWSFFSFPP